MITQLPKFFLILLLMSGYFISAMEHSQTSLVSIQDYNEATDKETVNAIYAKNWPFLCVGRDYDEKIVDILIGPDSCPEAPKSVKVLHDNNHVRGFVTYYHQVPQNRGYIEQLAIQTEYQKKGFGLQLMKYAIETLKQNDIEKILIYVRKNNIPALTLYEKLGFSEHTSAIKDTSWELTLRCK